MKKLMIVAAAAMGLAAFGDIESSNVVGYTTKDAAKGSFMILGVQFQGVGTTTYKVNDLITGMVGVDYGDGASFKATAPQIQIPVDGGYLTRYYVNDGWFDDNGKDGFKAGWCDAFGSLVDDEVTPGVAIWLKSVQNASNATVSGQVPDADTGTVECPSTFALRANIFPSAITLNTGSMTETGIVGVDFGDGSAFKTTAPQIQIPVDGGYLTRYYLNDGWYDDGSAEGAFKPGWCDAFGNLTSDVIPAAQGFWTKGVGSAFTLTFTK